MDRLQSECPVLSEMTIKSILDHQIAAPATLDWRERKKQRLRQKEADALGAVTVQFKEASRKGTEAIDTFNSESEDKSSVASQSLLRTCKLRAYCVDLWLAKVLDAIQVVVTFVKHLTVDPRVNAELDKIMAEA